MKVLVTGGTGTISSGIVCESVKRGYSTYAVTRGKNSHRNIAGAMYIYADVWDTDEIRNKINNQYYDVVVECLAYNVEQLKISLANFADKCNHYFFVSTAGVYRRDYENESIDEDSCADLHEWLYTKNKIECEKYIEAFFKNKNNTYTIIRPTVTYGNYRVPFPVVSRKNPWTIFDRIDNNKPVVGCSNVRFAIIHIDDFANAVVGLFDKSGSQNESFHIFETGKEVFWDEVIFAAGETLHKDVKLIHVPLEAFDILYPSIYDELKWNKSEPLILNGAKLKNVLPGFSQEIDIKKGVAQTIIAQKKEYELYNHELDEEFNYNCDLIILYALQRGLLALEEKQIALNYIASWRLYDKLEKQFRIIKRCIKKKIRKYHEK